jgi:hypothetical protein
MYRFLSRVCFLASFSSVLLTACAMTGLAQDLAQQPPAPLPITDTIPPDDPIMKAIRERAVIAPAKPSSFSETHPKISRKSSDRWRIVERLLRQARIMARDAESLEQLGDAESAEALTQLATSLRQRVVRMLQVAEKPLEEKDTTIP